VENILEEFVNDAKIAHTKLNLVRKRENICICYPTKDICSQCCDENEENYVEYIDTTLKLKLSLAILDQYTQHQEYIVFIFIDESSLVANLLKVLRKKQVYRILRQRSYRWHSDKNLRVSECKYESPSEPDWRPVSVFFQYS